MRQRVRWRSRKRLCHCGEVVLLAPLGGLVKVLVNERFAIVFGFQMMWSTQTDCALTEVVEGTGWQQWSMEGLVVG